MVATTIPVPSIATDPGFLWWGPLGTAEPTHTVVASQFSDAWPAGWVLLGATEEGHEFSWASTTDTIEVAEFLDPIKYVETGRTGTVTFAMSSIVMSNVKRALNGGTVTTTGTTTTTMASYTPPALGASVRSMIGWESQDGTERLVCFQVFNTAGVTIARRKGAAKASLPVTFSLEVPTTGVPFRYVTAGATRSA